MGLVLMSPLFGRLAGAVATGTGRTSVVFMSSVFERLSGTVFGTVAPGAEETSPFLTSACFREFAGTALVGTEGVPVVPPRQMNSAPAVNKHAVSAPIMIRREFLEISEGDGNGGRG